MKIVRDVRLRAFGAIWQVVAMYHNGRNNFPSHSISEKSTSLVA
jgi:hypothetical protein